MSGPDPLIGATIGGRFSIDAKLGQGGMATVYRATDAQNSTTVALKILPETLMGEPEYIQRFQREAASIQAFQHPNVIRIFARGTEKGVPFYAMEFLPFPDLEQHLRSEGILPDQEVLEILLGCARALETTHAQNLFHRDIKPANVVIAPGPRAVLVDFGLVRDTNRTQLTATGAIMGTPLYMSPELISGEKAAAPSDLYQVGLLAFEMMTGESAHAGESVMDVAHKCMTGEFDPVERYRPDLSVSWMNLVANLLANDPDDRYQTAGELVRELITLKRGGAVESRAGSAATQELSGAGSGMARDGASTAGEKDLGSGFSSGALRGLTESGFPNASLTASSLAHSALGTNPERPLPRWLTPLVLFVAVAILSMFVDLQGDYTPREVNLTTGLSGFHLTWKTSDACSGAVEVRSAESEPWTRFPPVGDEEPATTSHSVDVEGFEQGASLEYRILGMGDGPAVARTVKLAEFRLKELKLSPGSGESFFLSFKTGAAAECFLTIVDQDGEREMAFESEDGIDHRIQVPRLGADTEKIQLLVTTEAGDVVEEDLSLHLIRHGELLSERLTTIDVSALVREYRLAEGSPAAVTARMKRSEEGETKAQRRARHRAEENDFLKRVDTSVGRDTVRQIYVLVPWLLSGARAPRKAQAKIYRRLDRYYQLAWFSIDKGMRTLFDELPKDWGWYHETAGSRLPSGTEVHPVDIGEPTDFGPLLASTRMEYQFDLEKAPDEGAFAEVQLTIRKVMKDEIALRIVINEQAEIVFYGRRNLPHHSLDLFHGLPASYFRAGSNDLTVELVKQPANMTSKVIDLQRIRLRFGTEVASVAAVEQATSPPKKKR